MNNVSSDFDPVDYLVESYLERYRRGERPPLSEYTELYPELADRIRTLFPALMILEELGPVGDGALESLSEKIDFSPELPRRLGEYLLLRSVGSGGMGVVYEAIQESLGRRVALKVLPRQHLAESTRLERFRLEARAAGRLQHIHIVPVYGVGESDGIHYYTMRFIRGHGLDAVLREVKRLFADPTPTRNVAMPSGPDRAGDLARGLCVGCLPAILSRTDESTFDDRAGQDRCGHAGPGEPTSLAPSASGRAEVAAPSAARYMRGIALIGAQVAEALEYAHERGILHRDIKPSNLMLDSQGQVWVTDFGLAKARDSAELTRTGDIVGTLTYMAPERFNGWSDPRSDVYALGAKLYELLTFRPVFDEPDRFTLIERVLHAEPAPLRQLDHRIPRDLETIVLKALAKEPGERFATAGQLAGDLRRFVAGRPILARRSSVLERSWRWGKRNPVLALAMGAVAAALVTVAMLATFYANRQRHFAAAQSSANRRITALAIELERSLAESNRLLAIRNFERGQAALEKNQIGPGLLWMVESWRSAVAAREPAWQHAARANLAAWQPHHARLKSVLSHKSPVDSAAFSPDGKTILTGGDDRVARLWDVATGEPIGEPLVHEGTVYAVAYHPDGKICITASADKTAQLWNAASRQKIGLPIVHEGEVRAVAFSPDGQTFLTGTDHAARLWETATGRPLGEPLRHPGWVIAVAFSPDARVIFTAATDHVLRIWKAGSGHAWQPVRLLEADSTALAVGAGGKTIISGNRVGVVSFFDACTSVLDGHLSGRHQSSIRAVAQSPDGTMIVTGGTDKSAQLWDVMANRPIGPPIRHQGPVVGASFSPDSKAFVTASSDGTARLWDVGPVPRAPTVLNHHDRVSAVAYSPDGRVVVTASFDGTARQWNATTGGPTGVPMQHHERVLCMAQSPDGKTIVTGVGHPANSSPRGSARLWHAATCASFGPRLAHQDSVTAVAFSPDGKIVVTGSQDKTIRLWNASSGEPIGPFLAQPGAVEAVAFCPDGKTLVAAYDIGEAQIWDAATGTPTAGRFAHPGAVSAVAFSPDGHVLLTGCEDNKARLWDVERRKLKVPALECQGWVFSVAFSPDGKTVFTGSRGSDPARIWDAATGTARGAPLPQTDGVVAAAFSPDGKRLITGSYDGQARLFRTGLELPDDLERVATWVEVSTGLALDARQGSILVLDNAAWRERRERLRHAGGEPCP